jgi:hypothetical protein
MLGALTIFGLGWNGGAEGDIIVRPLLVLHPSGAAREAGLDSIVVGSKSLYGACISALTFRGVF